jgi:hypothetical protein
MKAIDQIQLLNELERRVELHIREFVEIFQNLDETTLLKPGFSGGWSIAQCFEHLNTYGNYYLPLMKSKLENQNGTSDVIVFKSTWLGAYFTYLMEPGKGMKKIKTFKKHSPERELDAYSVLRTFIDQQEILLKLIKKSGNEDLNKIKIPVSISRFVRLKLGDVLQFIVAHNERHLQQARRNL